MKLRGKVSKNQMQLGVDYPWLVIIVKMKWCGYDYVFYTATLINP